MTVCLQQLQSFIEGKIVNYSYKFDIFSDILWVIKQALNGGA